MVFTRVILFLFILTINIWAKKFDTRCKLARELIKVRILNQAYLGQWTCLIENGSSRNTSHVSTTPSGKKYYGLFQIGDRWCRQGKPGGDCKIPCELLIDDDIANDAACAQKIYKDVGFKYWRLFNARCKGNTFYTEQIYKCPDLMSPRPRSPRSSGAEDTAYSVLHENT